MSGPAITLYESLRDLFAYDEGGLPELLLEGVSPSEAQLMFELLLRLADPLRDDQTVWRQSDDQDVPIRDLDKPGQLAAQDRVGPFHVVLTGLRRNGVAIPDLGVRIEPARICVDYRAGAHWDAATTAAFVELLCDLRDRSEKARLLPADEAGEPLAGEDQRRFREAVENYCRAA